MKIAILGKVKPGLTYEEWVKKLESSFDVEKISHINITTGTGILNQYTRTYATSKYIPVTEYAADYKTYGDKARRIRNLALVGSSDLVIGFLSKERSKESWIYQQGVSTAKKAVVITVEEQLESEESTKDKCRHLIDMKRVIHREPNEEDLRYHQSISRDELLSVEDEVKLIKQIRQSEGDVDAAKDKLMRANHRFVRTIALQYNSKSFTIDELIAEGNIGLEHAIYKFDETRGFKFISYAVYWIRQSIIRAIIMKARAESESQGLSERELDILRMYFGIGCEKKTLEEIQAKYDLPPQRVIGIKNRALRKLSKLSENEVREIFLGTSGDNESEEMSEMH